jgi:hypothetical protein
LWSLERCDFFAVGVAGGEELAVTGCEIGAPPEIGAAPSSDGESPDVAPAGSDETNEVSDPVAAADCAAAVCCTA